ncbi:MAG: hypothetical protein CMM87_02610 [Rickettsiales bacterium]|nr:hypothetical protein [Rickettsiales bacterium]|tara:strand:- start:34559 stop:35533 length:975 start_codon:yes stop_codon:yes gene_type:complete
MTTPIALMGASGMVGQTVIAALANDQSYKIVEITGSEKRHNRLYGEEAQWLLSMPCPEPVKSLAFTSFDAIKSKYVISALPSDVAYTIEPALAQKGHVVFSNAAAHRLSNEAAMIVPEINPQILERALPNRKAGMIVTNPNCVVSIVSLALAPFFEVGLIKAISMTTLQSASGAGYPGVASLDLLSNVVPYIPEEETKISLELRHLFENVDVPISVQCNRVPIRVGHMASIELTLADHLSVIEAKRLMKNWSESHGDMLIVHDNPTLPQPMKSLSDFDMRVHVGRVQMGLSDRHIRFCVLGDNLARGAAGAAIGNMKLYDEFVK